MPIVWIPSLLYDLTCGVDKVQAQGVTVGEVIDFMESRYPGVKARLCDGNVLHAYIHVVVDGQVINHGLSQVLEKSSEIHFLPAISGGVSQ